MEFYCLYDYIHAHPHEILEIKTQYLSLLRELTEAPDISNVQFVDTIKSLHSMGKTLIGVVNNEIVCSGTIIIEPKLIRGGRAVGHIEDIVVLHTWRRRGLGQTLIDQLKTYGFGLNCYKIILDCSSELEVFYEKSGFLKKGTQMSLYQ